MDNKYDIYICYSRKDNEVATDICHFFDQQGLSYWIDRRRIESGDNYAQSIVNAIKDSNLFLFIISESSGKSKFCINELAFARQNKKIIFPIRIDQTPFSDELSFLIAELYRFDYFNKEEWQRGLLHYFQNSTEKDYRVIQKELSEQSTNDNKPSSWSSVRIGEEEKDALLKICCNRLCDVYIDGDYLCEARNKVIINVPVEYGSYILGFEDKENAESYKVLAIDILSGTKSKAVAVELPETKGHNKNKEEITCFIAGSKRLMAERDKMRAVVANMYVKWKSRNFLIETYSFDNFNHTASEIGHQEEYNQFIKNDADLALFLFDDEVGKETEKELNIAINSFKAKKHPQYIIYSMIKESVSPAIESLKARLVKEDVYWVDYESLEDLAVKFERDLNDYLVRMVYIKNKN